jgi:hypothetical protein
VKQFSKLAACARVRLDPCRLVRQVKQFQQPGRSQPTNSFTCRASRQGSVETRAMEKKRTLKKR